MKSHGHAKTDQRNLALHRLALSNLEREPRFLKPVLALLDRWLTDEAQRRSWPHLRAWREMLTEWPFQKMAARVLDLEAGQALRQCSPLGPVLTPRERWAAFVQADRQAILPREGITGAATLEASIAQTSQLTEERQEALLAWIASTQIR